MPDYDVLASHYDVLTGDVAEEAAFIRGHIERRCAGAVTLLDVACGTGGITALLARAYQVSGLDISPGMLALARDRLPPGTPLHQSDMTSFDLGVTFDVVVCSYQAVNHLLDFSAWRAFFGCVHRHLSDGGMFLFDVATISYFAMAANVPATVRKFGDNYLRRKVDATGAGTFEWKIEVFERQPDGRHKVLREVLTMRSFPLDDIRQALAEGFTGIAAIDRHGDAAGDESAARTWFVCTKPVRRDPGPAQ